MKKDIYIHNNRLSLVPFSKKHISKRYIHWLNDKDVVRYSEQRHRNHTYESCVEFIKSFDNSSNVFLAIEEIINGFGHIGNITIYYNEPNKIADIGILIGEKNLWGKGYGLEAFNLVCDYLFRETTVRKITAGTISINLPMLKVMKKMNMIDDGVRKNHYLCEGKVIDIIHMALFRE